MLETIPDKDKVKQYLQAIVQYVAVQGPISLERLGEYTRRLPGGDETMQTAAQQIKKEAYNEFMQEQEKMLVEREKHAKLENSQENLIDVATEVYGPLPGSLYEKIKSIQSLENLRALNRKVIRTQSLDEFTELVNRAAQ